MPMTTEPLPAYRALPIAECGDPLVAIPADAFAFTDPHPYMAFGAPYGNASPWMLRRRVLDALLDAQARLSAHSPGWRLKLFDAYRPVAVQAFMVWREFRQQAERAGRPLDGVRSPEELAARDPGYYRRLAAVVFRFWGVPSEDPRTPPPHSTGAAVDLTLQDAAGRETDMGCPIDETSERAYPDFFAASPEPALRAIHARRELLNRVMAAAGFNRHANEWWHFSLGDQMAACARGEPAALYGRAQ
ncbi:MAG TPA: M15 family metallopeptidase [Rhodocyclaceae bacterium]